VIPDAVLGHSQGEIAAATVAGILPLGEAARVVAVRSRALAGLAGSGGMVSVTGPEAAVRELAGRWGERLAVAAVNGPAAVVISGEPGALRELAAACGQAGLRAQVLPVDYASHSVQVEQVREELAAGLAGLTPETARIPMISAMSGQWLAGPEAGAGYWYDSLRAPVQFGRAVRVLAAEGFGVFIEVSPHPVLTAAVAGTAEDAAGTAGAAGTADAPAPVVSGTLRRGDGGAGRFPAALAQVHVHGTAVDWAAVLGGGQRVGLPTYAFQRQRYWPRPVRPRPDVTSAGLGAVGHPLLGAAVELAGGAGVVLTGRVSLGVQRWLGDHAVGGVVLLPGTAFVELAVVAGDAAGCGRVEELVIEAPLVLPADGGVQLQVTVGGPDQDELRTVEVYARPAGAGPQAPWTRHASGVLGPAGQPGAGLTGAGEFAVWPPQGAEPVATGDLYDALAAGGYGYGPSFRGLRAAWRRGPDIFAEVALPDDAAADAGMFRLHPALLDGALHAVGLTSDGEPSGAGAGEVRLPFAWNGVSLHAAGARMLRTRLSQDGRGGWSLAAADGTGALVVSVESLALRPVPVGALQTARTGSQDALFRVEWVPVPMASSLAVARWIILGDDRLGLSPGLTAAGTDLRSYTGPAALAEAIEAGEPVPEVALACAGAGARAAADAGAGEAARAAAGRVLSLVQQWLAEPRLEAVRLVLVTRGAVTARPGEAVSDLAGAAARGLLRSAQSENPDRLVLADLPAAGGSDGEEMARVLAAALDSGEPELAVRDQTVYGRRLARPSSGLVPPGDAVPWRLDVTERGTLDGLALVPCPQAAAPLRPGQVRVGVRAAGLNFRDVLIGLDMYPGTAVIGGEIAGVVTETGPGVTGLVPGDRALGLAEGGFGPVAITDARVLAPIPPGWSFAEAASVPVAFATAWYALVDLAGARPGQRLLVHAAAGGVGMAAVAIARHLGLDVYGTASSGKHHVLAAMGLDAAHVASSRTAEFEQRFLAATGGAGMDIVLNALAGELTDASLRLLTHGGAFVEMGKTDLRDPAQVAVRHPGVTYRFFETREAGPERLGQILSQVTSLLTDGQLMKLPVQAWDVRRARDAFRFMSQARHTGKIVLTIPPDAVARRQAGTTLITGGTGTLGAVVARHLAVTGQARHLVLVSRSGPAAAGTAALAADLAAAGAGVQVAACDAADRSPLAGLFAQIPPASPVTGVVHLAGVLDDGMTGALTPARVDAVMRPKADAAWHLHELTKGADLRSFILFSSAAATFGGAGQGNYAAANAFLDALASYRRNAGLPAVSLAWGLWADASTMTGHLSQTERARITRGGMIALTTQEGLALLDVAVARDEAELMAARLDVAGLGTRTVRDADIPALWRGLVGSPARPAAVAGAGTGAADTLRRQLAGLPGPDRARLLLDLVRTHVAAVIGHTSTEAVQPDQSFRELGFDSLTAVELRNRLGTATGLRLPATVVFDHPTPVVLARYLQTEIVGQEAGYPLILEELDRLESALSAIAGNNDGRAKIITRLEALLNDLRTGTMDNTSTYHEIDEATDEKIFSLIDKELGI
jgi:NADPH:quinone reductase-like Zn-dependent oxidoreductase/acyl carrier protein